MSNIQNQQAVDALKQRIKKLDFDTPARWGKFDAHQMICHLQDSLKYALHMVETSTQLEKGPPMFIRHLIRLYMPMPKGKIQTTKDFLKTKPDNWEKDMELLLQLLDRFSRGPENGQWPMHPFFGYLDAEAWGKIYYRHFNHHLKQFGL